MEVVHARCAGLDISKTDAKVSVRIAGRGRRKPSTTVTTWSATSSSILRLADMLAEQKVTCVVMEATGAYWKPFYSLLAEAGLPVMLVNASQVRQIPGRKTDVADAVWLADLAAHGLVRASFVPKLEITQLKDLVRARTILVRLRGEEVQRLEKLLESAALKLSSVISDLNGVSGRRMIEALIAGERDPDVLAGLGHGLLKASRAELAEALTGRFSDHHGFLAKVHLDLIDSYTARIADLAARIETYFEPDRPAPGQGPSLHRARELLVTIPGISLVGAEQILAEIGTDMTVFASPGRLASWAGLAPGAHESAGKVKSTRCRPGNSYLKGTMGIVAMTAARQKRSFLSARYRRVRARRGHRRALVALARTILELCWHLLTTDQPYHDRGADYYDKRRPGTAIKTALQRLRDAGCHITTNNEGILITTA
jgi:transposase